MTKNWSLSYSLSLLTYLHLSTHLRSLSPYINVPYFLFSRKDTISLLSDHSIDYLTFLTTACHFFSLPFLSSELSFFPFDKWRPGFPFFFLSHHNSILPSVRQRGCPRLLHPPPPNRWINHLQSDLLQLRYVIPFRNKWLTKPMSLEKGWLLLLQNNEEWLVYTHSPHCFTVSLDSLIPHNLSSVGFHIPCKLHQVLQ